MSASNPWDETWVRSAYVVRSASGESRFASGARLLDAQCAGVLDLAAAAPDMCRALVHLREIFASGDCGPSKEELAIIDAALAKARGQQ